MNSKGELSWWWSSTQSERMTVQYQHTLHKNMVKSRDSYPYCSWVNVLIGWISGWKYSINDSLDSQNGSTMTITLRRQFLRVYSEISAKHLALCEIFGFCHGQDCVIILSLWSINTLMYLPLIFAPHELSVSMLIYKLSPSGVANIRGINFQFLQIII